MANAVSFPTWGREKMDGSVRQQPWRRYRAVVFFIAICAGLLLTSRLVQQSPERQTHNTATLVTTNPPTAQAAKNAPEKVTERVVTKTVIAEAATTTAHGSYTDKAMIYPGDLWTARSHEPDAGVLFDLEYLGEFWTSPNKEYRLYHSLGGDFVIEHRDSQELDFWSPLWWTNTGSGENSEIHGRSMMTLDPDGTVRVKFLESYYAKDANHPAKFERGKELEVWNSDLQITCRRQKEQKARDKKAGVVPPPPPPANNPVNPAGVVKGIAKGLINGLTGTLTKKPKPVKAGLSLDNSGRLVSYDDQGEIACVLYNGTQQGHQMQYGRLALLVTGPYGRAGETCKSQVDKIIKAWPGTGIDIFMHTTWYDDNEQHREEQKKAIHDCYGEWLVDLDIVEPEEMRVEYDGYRPEYCTPESTNKLYSELASTAKGAAMMQKHIYTNGTKYQATMRLRPDTHFHGLQPYLRRPSELGHNQVLSPHRYGEHHFWCHLVDGTVTQGPSEIVYGRPEAVAVWTDLYYHLDDLLRYGQAGVGYSSFAGCDRFLYAEWYSKDGSDKKDGENKEKEKSDKTDAKGDADKGDAKDGDKDGDKAQEKDSKMEFVTDKCWNPTCGLECIIPYWLSSRNIEYVVDWNWQQSPAL